MIQIWILCYHRFLSFFQSFLSSWFKFLKFGFVLWQGRKEGRWGGRERGHGVKSSRSIQACAMTPLPRGPSEWPVALSLSHYGSLALFVPSIWLGIRKFLKYCQKDQSSHRIWNHTLKYPERERECLINFFPRGLRNFPHYLFVLNVYVQCTFLIQFLSLGECLVLMALSLSSWIKPSVKEEGL